ncbi:hypothetical protein SAMN03159343_0244 [Klenkia marina]|uniref:Uncharacterized protein n=1 Tax=Klenkia marina TaxID=1960309 RepID=A0A1G4X9N6_9ACTN|nr:hypothetical protein [Klenkia marina]SCX37940.1 hypothetical protein SAMN03159343_0244 [Klenkia marina]
MSVDPLAFTHTPTNSPGGPMDWPVFITFAIVFVLVGGWILWNKMKGRG